jgi:aminopeptidase YwaD
VLVDEREAVETRIDHGHVKVVAGPRAVDDGEVARAREGDAQELLQPLAHASKIPTGHRAKLRPMRRYGAIGVIGACLAFGLAAVPAADAAFHGEAARTWTKKIAALGQRPAGGRHERQAGGIVLRRLDKLGYHVGVQRFRLPNGQISRNIVGRTSRPRRVLIVAHIDGVWGTPAANDNASGIGVLLELARALRDKPGVMIAALGAEERHVTGSPYHLGSLRLIRSLTSAQRKRIRFAMSVDMVGVGTRLHIRGIESTPNRSARIALAWARALGFRVTYLQDSGSSDHAEMSRAGMPAAWITWRWDTCWHEPCDRIGRVRRSKLGRAGRLLLVAARRVIG